MGYRVVYEPAPKQAAVIQERKSRIPGMAAAFFLLFLLLVNGFWPKGRDVLQQILWPGDGETVWNAAESFARNLRCGETFSDAAESFCREILLDADLEG